MVVYPSRIAQRSQILRQVQLIELPLSCLMSSHGGDQHWITSDTGLRNPPDFFNIGLRVLPTVDLDFDLHGEIFRYRTGFDAILVKPFVINGQWEHSYIHNHTVVVLLLTPERKTGMRLATGHEFTVLGCQKNDPLSHVNGYEVLYLKAEQRPLSIIIKHPRNSRNCLVFDAYSGFGGWAFGGRIVGAPYRVFWEIDEETAQLCARNTGTHVLHTSDILNMTHDTFRHHLSMGITILGDFGEKAVWEFIAQDGIAWGSFSLPCPSWSRLSTERGLEDDRGGEHLNLLAFAQSAQPLLIALENVEALLSHRHWIDIREKFVELGFHLTYVGSDSLQKVMPMSRNRACVILTNRAYASEFRASELSCTDFPPLDYMMNPRSCGYIHDHIPDGLLPLLTIDSVDREILMDRKVWPFDWGFGTIRGHSIPLMARVHSKSQILPCAVAKYASPQSIARYLLESKGLFMKIMQQADDTGDNWFFRWISPFEQLAAMGFPAGTMIPVKKPLAFQVVGNAISVAHSIISLLRVRTLLPQTFRESGKADLFDALVEMRINIGKLPKMQFNCDDEYMWLSVAADPTVDSVIHDHHSRREINTPAIQKEVEAIAELFKHEESNIDEGCCEVLKTKTGVPDAPFVFQPVEHSELQGVVTYTIKAIAVCVPQTVFSTISRTRNMLDFTHSEVETLHSECVGVQLQTMDGTWIWKGQTTTPCISVGVLVRTALPHATSALISSIVLNGSHCDWNFMIDTREYSMITIAFQPRFMVKCIQIVPGQFKTPILCDICDTPETVAQVMIDNYHELKHMLTMTNRDHAILSHEYLLAQQSTYLVLKVSNQSKECKIGAIHPITGKYHEFLVPLRNTIRDLYQMIAPELGAHIPIVAEIDHQRISTETSISDIDPTKVVRFRCFPMQGGG